MSATEIKAKLEDKTRPVFTIGVAADMIGVSVHTLRMYENEGLIFIERTESKRRLYSKVDIERLQCIRMMIEDRGFNLAGIKGFMSLAPCWDMKGCSEADQQQCDAYETALEPCWAVKRKGPFCKDVDCSTCIVYSEISTCHNIKSFLKQHWKNA